MTSALTQPRSPDTFPLSAVALPVVAGAPKVWNGARVYLDVIFGGIRPGIAGNQNLFVAGDAEETVDNSGGSTTAPCLVRLADELHCEWLDNSTASPVTTLFGLCYVDSDHSVSALAAGNSVAGRVWALDTVKGVLVQPLYSLLESYLGEEASSGGNAAFTALAVATVMHAYTGTGTGTLVSTANGTLASQITTAGVVLAVGQVFFAPAGLTGLSGAVDSGPWQVVSLGAAGSKWIVTRPPWWATGANWVTDAAIKIGAGDSIYNNTEWKAYNASGVIDTSDPGFYCKEFNFQLTLTAGTLALTAGQPNLAAAYPLTSGGTHTCPVGIFSASQSTCLATLNTQGGSGNTVGFGAKALTPGYVGTAAVSLFAFLAALATATSDTSTINVKITNP
jgi:hypothetical protein